jgi:hypothetical protein
MEAETTFIGRVTRCSTRGFVGALRAPQPEIPIFGAFCKAEAQRGASEVIGLIYDIRVEDDELTRQVAATEHPLQEELADQQYVRQIPIEYSALAIGFKSNDSYVYTLPPQPPFSLAPIHVLEREEVATFTNQLNFIPLVLSAEHLPKDELLAAALRMAAQARPEAERKRFLLEAGRFCARVLAQDLVRMDTFLRSLSA